MRHPAISPRSPALMFCLALSPDPVSIRALSQILQLDEDVVLERVTVLEEAQFVCSDKSRALWAVADEKKRRELGELAARFMLSGGRDNLAKALARLWAGRLLDGAVVLGRTLRRLINEAQLLGAIACLDIFLRLLEEWNDAEHSSEENEGFIRVAKRVLGVVLYLAKRRRRAKAVFDILIKTAASMGDKRTVLKVKMMRACLHYTIGGVLEGTPETVMDAVIKEIDEMGDEDILVGAKHGIGIRHYINGNFAEVIDLYRFYDGRLQEEERFYSGIATQCVVFAACNLGRFGNALGASLAVLRAYCEAGMKYAERRSRILCAEALLRAGMPDEALKKLDDAWACSEVESESRLTMLTLRGLAFYHFQVRNMPYAHRMLMECARVAAKYNIQHAFRWLPDILEMLWKFQELGFPPIPGYELDVLLDRVLTDPSVQSRGIALRIKARMLNGKGRHKAALPLLEAALAHFVRCRTPMDQARTQIEMARSLVGLGRNDEARPLHAMGCAILEEYNQYDRHWYCDEESRIPRPRAYAEGVACAEDCRSTLLNLAEWSTFSTHAQWIIDCLRDALKVERVALYTVEDDYLLRNLAARDFTAKEYTEKLPSMYGKRLLDCVRSGRVSRWRSRYGACLCLPLRISKKRNCVFFAHCEYLTGSIMGPDSEYFEPVRALAEEEVRLVYRVAEGVNAIEVRNEAKSRLARERLTESSGIYYGPAMKDIIEQADKAASTAVPVLILGETGSGKEELSRRMHRKSGRPGMFVAVNPASIPEQLFESELFGYEKGAFTGAHEQKIGLLEIADKGTLFFDEIGEIPLSFQVKLLRVLQGKQFSRLGGTKLLYSDFRLISATNQDLRAKIREGLFREDLYYRIAVVPLIMPPVRERPEDIKHLAEMFQAYFSSQYKVPVPPISPEELEYLCSLPWKGNVRELRGFIERAVILYNPVKTGFLQEARMDAEGVEDGALRIADGERESVFICDDLPPMEELQRRYMEHVLRLTRGKVGGELGAHRILNMKLSSLYKKMKKYGLDKVSLLYGRE